MLKQLAKTAVKSVAAAASTMRRPSDGVTILIYHRVGGSSGNEVDLDRDVFADQMAELADSGLVITLDHAVQRLATTMEPQPGIVITFDDGTPDVIENALPILEHHGLPMTLYLATEPVERCSGFWRATDRPLSWTALADALDTGLMDIGSHTHSHALLDRMPAHEIEEELDRSIELIGERLGVIPRHFAYPKALPPSRSADLAVRERFQSAALAGTRSNAFGKTDIYRLSRSPIQRSDGMYWFRKKADGGMWVEDRLRVVLNRARYVGATR